MDRGAWGTIAHGITNSHTRLSDRAWMHTYKKLWTCRRLDNSILQNFHSPVPTSLPNPPIPLTHTPHQKPGSVQFSSVQFSCSVMSNSLRPHELQHARPPCLSPTPRVYPNSCPVSQWCHPTILSSSTAFIFLASGFFQMRQLFGSCGHSIGLSASASVLPNITQDWSPLGWTGWISLQSKGLSWVISNTTVQKPQFFGPQLSL